MGEYKTGRVCLNGHAVSSDVDGSPELNEKFCSRCGAETITACPECDAVIRGHRHLPSVITTFQWKPSGYCYNCGVPYPWTKARIEALSELLDELENIPDDQRAKLKDSIPHIMVDTPRSETAALRFKKLLKQVDPDYSAALEKSIVAAATEAVKTLIGL